MFLLVSLLLLGKAKWGFFFLFFPEMRSEWKRLLFVNAWLRVEEREQNFNLKLLASQLSEFIISYSVIFFLKVLMCLCKCNTINIKNKPTVCSIVLFREILLSYYMVCYYSTKMCVFQCALAVSSVCLCKNVFICLSSVCLSVLFSLSVSLSALSHCLSSSLYPNSLSLSFCLSICVSI